VSADLEPTRVWSAVIRSAAAHPDRRGFDDSREVAWLPCVSPFSYPDDRDGEARARLLAVGNLCAWLAGWPALDPGSLASVEGLLRSVRELQHMLAGLNGSLEAMRVDLQDIPPNETR
jgi:hypothetical protein